MFNVENKKQILTIFFAIALGIVAVIFTSKYVKDSVEYNNQRLAQQLKQEYESKLDEQLAEQGRDFDKRIDKMKEDMAGQLQQVLEETARLRTQEVVQLVEEPKKIVPVQAFSIQTPPGKRAVTVLIDPLSAVGGLVSPGDFVDIIARMELPEGDGKDIANNTNYVTTMLFQNVQVLAVGTNFKSLGLPPEYENQQVAKQLYVTLALSPEESGLMTFVQAHGSLKFALRSPTSNEVPNLQVASWDTLSDYLLEKQGTQVILPRGKAAIRPMGAEEVKSVIQIFRKGEDQTK